MAAFLSTQLDFIFFFYGLAFILLGGVCFAIRRHSNQRTLWGLLGAFGFLHGTSEWLDLTALVLGDTQDAYGDRHGANLSRRTRAVHL